MDERLICDGKRIIYRSDSGDRVILDCGYPLKNKSAVPMKTIGEKGEAVYPQIRIIDALRERDLSAGTEEEKADINFLINTLLCDRLKAYSRPIRIGIMGFDEERLRSLAYIIDLFNEKHDIILVDPQKYGQLKEGGFDLILANVQKSSERQLVMAIKYLSHPDTQCIILSASGVLMGDILDIFTKRYEKYHIYRGGFVYVLKGVDYRDEAFERKTAEDLFKGICNDILQTIHTDDETDRLHNITLEINEGIFKARSEWDLFTKQKLIDMKESIQYYMLYRDDRYAAEYEKALIEQCSMAVSGV